MADALAVVLGVGIASFVMFYLVSHLQEEHFLLKLLTIFFVLAMALLIPKALMDSNTICEPVVNSTNVTGNLTTYTYMDYCYSSESEAGFTFLKGMMWFYRLFIAYVILFLGYQALLKLKESAEAKGRR